MVATAPFNPPSPNLSGKPHVPAWVPPPVTKETHNFAKLKSIDLSKMDSDDPAIVEELVQEMKVAIRDDGFIFLENYGVSQEQASLSASAFTMHTLTWPFVAQPSVLAGTVPLR